jgi:hypothetical protein
MLQIAILGISCKNGWEALNHLDSTLQEAALLSGERLGAIGEERRSTLSSDPNHPRYAGVSVYRVNALCLMVILADNTKLVLEEQAAKTAVRTDQAISVSLAASAGTEQRRIRHGAERAKSYGRLFWIGANPGSVGARIVLGG